MMLFQSLTNKGNTIEITSKLFKLLNVRVTRTTLEGELSNHPDYPSLLSMSDILTTHGIENISLKASIDQLVHMPMPCIAPIKVNNSDEKFSIIENVSEKNVRYFNPISLRSENITTDEFFDKWTTGILMLVDGYAGSEEKGYTQKRREEKRAFFFNYATYAVLPLLVLLISTITLFKFGASATLPVLYTIMALAGLITSTILVWYEIDEYHPSLHQICKAGAKINCSAVLSSSASKVFGVSWSLIGFVYFFGSILGLLTQGILDKHSLFLMGLLSIAALPYIFFSIYYQWRIAKQWCIFCLTVQGILALQGGIALFAKWGADAPFTIILRIEALFPFAISYLIPAIALGFILPAFRLSQVNRRHHKELVKFKHNPQIFQTLLEKQKQVNYSTANLGITLGNPNATYKIIKVCNPYCGPCSKAHIPMEELINSNPEVQVQIIFTASDDEHDKRAAPVRHLLAIQDKYGEKMTKQAIDDWYLAPKKDYDAFALKYHMNGELEKQTDRLKGMEQWCRKMDIRFTPTIFVNGHQLPEMYTVHDLKYFLSI